MPTVRELAEIAGKGELADRARQLKAADAQGDLQVTAWLVHQFMAGGAQRQGGTEVPGAEPNAAWLRWEGTLANALAELHLVPRSRDDSDAGKSLSRAVSMELRHRGNAVCTYRSAPGDSSPTIWAVRAEYREDPVLDPSWIPILNGTRLSRGQPPLSGSASLTVPFADGSAVAAAATATQRQASPPPSTPAPAPAPTSAATSTGAASAAAAANDATPARIRCEYCRELYDKSFIARHVFHKHSDPVPPLLDVIRKRGTMTRVELADTLSQAAGGGIVNPGFVGRLLSDHVNGTNGACRCLRFHKGWASDCYYIWDGATATATSAARADPVTQPVQPSEPAKPKPVKAAASPPSAISVTPVVTSYQPPLPAAFTDNGHAATTAATAVTVRASASEPSPVLPLDELLDAFSRHTASYISAVRAEVTSLQRRITELEAKLHAAEALAASSKMSAADQAELEDLRTEVTQLRAFRERARSLFGS